MECQILIKNISKNEIAEVCGNFFVRNSYLVVPEKAKKV